MASEGALGNAGYAVTGSGGGGEGGRYVFADLTELDAIIKQWTQIRDAILLDGDKITQVEATIVQPADDEMSRGQFTALNASLEKARDHNETMRKYTHSYVKKLEAAREQYMADDRDTAIRLRSTDAR